MLIMAPCHLLGLGGEERINTGFPKVGCCPNWEFQESLLLVVPLGHGFHALCGYCCLLRPRGDGLFWRTCFENPERGIARTSHEQPELKLPSSPGSCMSSGVDIRYARHLADEALSSSGWGEGREQSNTSMFDRVGP